MMQLGQATMPNPLEVGKNMNACIMRNVRSSSGAPSRVRHGARPAAARNQGRQEIKINTTLISTELIIGRLNYFCISQTTTGDYYYS